MELARRYIFSSVGRKYIMALTGLAWSLFVATHMAGNLLLFVGPEIYNKYGHAIVSNPLVYVAEAGLVIFLSLHAYTGISLWIKNRNSKPSMYAVKATTKVKGATVASRSMAYTGSIVLVFIILHLITFKYGTNYVVSYDGKQIRDLYRLVAEVFQTPAYVVWYALCMVFVGVHLYHGLASSFQTLGLNHPRYNALIKKFGYAYSFVVAAGFLSQPLFFLFVAGN
jgi:succinate dehydrogenase / fumarate reductase, cytochrome b subunit